MRSLDLLRLNLSALLTRTLHHQLLHKQRNRAILLTQQIRRRDLEIRSARGGRILRSPGMRPKRLGPFLAVGHVVEEKAERVAGSDSPIFLLSRSVLSVTEFLIAHRA